MDWRHATVLAQSDDSAKLLLAYFRRVMLHVAMATAKTSELILYKKWEQKSPELKSTFEQTSLYRSTTIFEVIFSPDYILTIFPIPATTLCTLSSAVWM